MNLPIIAHSKYIIFSDCRSSLRKLQNEHHAHLDAITSQVVHTIYHLQPFAKSISACLPGHCDVVGHDIIDAVTKSKTHAIVLLIDSPDPLSQLLEYGAQVELRTIKPTIGNWTKKLSKIYGHSRLLKTAINLVVLGHSNITHDHVFTKQLPYTCTECNISLLTRHILH